MCAHTHTCFLLPKCLTFLWRLTEITQLIPPQSWNDRLYCFQQVPAATENLCDWRCSGDVRVMYSGAVTSEQNTHSSTVNVKFRKSSLRLLGAWERRLGYLRRDKKSVLHWICSTQGTKRRFSEFGPSESWIFNGYSLTAISKETALFGLQQTQSMSPVPICQVSNRIFAMILP